MSCYVLSELVSAVVYAEDTVVETFEIRDNNGTMSGNKSMGDKRYIKATKGIILSLMEMRLSSISFQTRRGILVPCISVRIARNKVRLPDLGFRLMSNYTRLSS